MQKDINSSITKIMVQGEVSTPKINPQIDESKFDCINLSSLASFGALGTSIANLIGQIGGSNGGSGLYRVNLNPGEKLVNSASGSGYRGFSMDKNGISSHAVLSPIDIDIQALVNSIASLALARQLSRIEKRQTDMFDFVKTKERSTLIGDLNTLIEIFNQYKYNLNNEHFKIANYKLAKDIKNEMEKSINLYKETIASNLANKEMLPSGFTIGIKLKEARNNFSNYHLALYLFSFASFLEVLLLENYDKEFLDTFIKKIDQYSSIYHDYAKQSVMKAQELLDKAVEGNVAVGIKGLSKFLGNVSEKIPFLKDNKIDEKIENAGDKILDFSIESMANSITNFKNGIEDFSTPFKDSIKLIGTTANKLTNAYCDNNYLYIEKETSDNENTTSTEQLATANY